MTLLNQEFTNMLGVQLWLGGKKSSANNPIGQIHNTMSCCKPRPR
jgi:hypothetical protein